MASHRSPQAGGNGLSPREFFLIAAIIGVLSGALIVGGLVLFTKPGRGSGSAGQAPATDAPAASTDGASGGGDASSTQPTQADVAEGEVVSGVKSLARPAVLSNIRVAKASNVKGSLTPEATSFGLSQTDNADDFYLNDQEKSALDKHGFFVSRSGSDEFFDVYETNRYNHLASFVTVDSMMHTYHLYFFHLLKTTEKSSLSNAVGHMSTLMLQESEKQIEQVSGTAWEDAAWRNVAFFAVGARLMDPAAVVPEQVEPQVEADLSAINAAQGIDTSAITGDMVDFSQFKPRGYYEGDEQLERYFRTMMWYGQINFKQSEEGLDRSAALMCCALSGDALSAWEQVYAVTSFFAGASDDNGYCEYYPLVEEAWGQGAGTAELAADPDDGFARFHELTAQAKAPRINSVPGMDDGGKTDKVLENKGFRLMGQRFSLDAAIFQQLIYSTVGENASGEKRLLPDALDIPAALGSDEAYAILESRGAMSYPKYQENMDRMRGGLSGADNDAALWNASLYSQWLYTLNPLLVQKGDGYPAFMRTQEWTRKNLQSYLGSYTELKHDTVLYAKQVMAEMGGDPPFEHDDRGYVEPEPTVFARLSALTRATSEGLKGYGMLDATDEANLELLAQLADQLEAIATKELAGELPTDDEFELIRSYGGQIEHFWQEVYKDEADNEYFRSRDFPAALVTDVATDPNGSCLELGTGRANELYVIVSVDGSPRVARGSVYSFYQFSWPLSDRMTDTQWREILHSSWSGDGVLSNGIAPEDWTAGFTVGY